MKGSSETMTLQCYVSWYCSVLNFLMFYPKLQIKKVELHGADAGVTGVSIVIRQFIVFKTVEKRLVFTSLSKKFIKIRHL